MTAVVRIVDSGYRLEAYVHRPQLEPERVAYAVMDRFGWALMARAGKVTELASGIYVRALTTLERVDFDPPGVTTYTAPVHTPRGVAHAALWRVAHLMSGGAA